MRVPAAWLRSLCDPGLGAAEVGELLTMAGVKVERLHRIGVGDPAAFVVGRVLEAARHPDADRLSVCTVDDGSGEPRTIVCGAPNVAAGQTVAVALPGAVMPDGTELGEAKLRGVRSRGMILAEDELAIGEDHDGILVLDNGAAPGDPLAAALPIADEVIELEITPNRPDVMGVYGVAREVHAVTGAALAEDPADADAVASGEDDATDHASVEIADPDICPRFTARVFEDVRIGPSPPWLKQRLTAAGQRPISNVVDITNYVMLLYGQPLHAFDLDRVRGRSIVVRRAREGETMTTLDGVERSFSRGVALVCDAEGPSGIAGIMGGAVSEVSPATTRVLMESATWVGPNIMRSSRALGLRSEASARFEKGLHPETAMAAQRVAAKLMVDLCGARLVPGTIDAYPTPAPPRTVGLRPARIEALLGQSVPESEIRGLLGRLGFEAVGGEAASARIEVSVPPFRDGDVQREADLIEEVARIHGLDRLPGTLPARRSAVGRLTSAQRLRRRLEDALRDRGLSEVVAYSFTSVQTLRRLRLNEGGALRVRNPLSEEGALLRPLLLSGLLDAAAHNAAHARSELALFESAHVYASGGATASPPEGSAPSAAQVPPPGSASPRGARPAAECHHLAGLLTRSAPATWRSEDRPADFYAARAAVEALLAVAGVEWHAEPAQPSSHPFLHPGRAAVVLASGGHELGWLGELHPLVVREWGVPAAAVFELDADALSELAPASGEGGYRDLTSFPAVTHDLAVIVGEETSAAEVERAMRAGGGELLRSVRPFDLYRGDQLGPGRKSLALRLEFRASDRTLTEAEVAERRSAIEAALAEIGGGLRA